MTLAEALLFSGLQGLTGILPLSPSGHRAAAELWLGSPAGLDGLVALGKLGCLLAILTLGRKRLVAASREAIRRWRRPRQLLSSPAGRDAVTIVGAASIALAFGLLLEPLLKPLRGAPLLAGVGLLLTAAALLSTLLADRSRRVGPNITGVVAVGLAQGLAFIPGLSPVAAGYAVLIWLGIKGWPAAELALLTTAPVLALQTARFCWSDGAWGELPWSTLAIASVAAMATAAAAAVSWRTLCGKRDRTPLFNLWIVPLALALLAYGYALDLSLQGHAKAYAEVRDQPRWRPTAQ